MARRYTLGDVDWKLEDLRRELARDVAQMEEERTIETLESLTYWKEFLANYNRLPYQDVISALCTAGYISPAEKWRMLAAVHV